VLHIRKILNAWVTLPTEIGGCALVKSTSWEGFIYKIHNLELKWSYCECLQSQRGFILQTPDKSHDPPLPFFSERENSQILWFLERYYKKVGLPKHCTSPWHLHQSWCLLQLCLWMYDFKIWQWIWIMIFVIWWWTSSQMLIKIRC
jgi:hypothetical protein